MKRWIYAYRYAAGSPELLERTLLARAGGLLTEATAGIEQDPAADGSFTVDLTTPLAGIDIAKRIRVHVGVAHRRATRVVLPVRWHADPARLAFPEFTGTLELEPLDARTVQLSMAGSYGVPLGVLGAVVDATVLQGAAQRTAEHLVGRLARALTQAAGTPVPRPARGPRPGEPLRVADVMTSDPLTVDAELPLRTTAMLLFHAEISGAPVVSRKGELVGVISEHDLLAKEATSRFGWGRKAADEDRRRWARTAGEACTRPALVTAPGARLGEVARAMLDADVSRMVVVDAARVAGIVTRHDVLAALLREDADIAYAVQQVVEREEAPGVKVDVAWGEVRLAGTAPLRSTADRLPVLVAAVEGVMAVDGEELAWADNDVLPPVPFV